MNIPITRKQFIKYVALPGFRPRLVQLFMSGFDYIPYFIALVYQSVRLLPANHPYTQVSNIGRYGIRHVIGEAANHLVISPRHIDQLVLFVCILAGLVIFVVQICLLVGALIFQPVFALPPNLFTTGQPPDQDIAFILLDMVFGVPDLFNSCVSTRFHCEDLEGVAIPDFSNPFILGALGYVSAWQQGAEVYFPFAYHTGLHQMFQFYSLGLLIVAIIIASYFIITVLAETAETGTPFGKRFNKVWAPLRFAAAFGLLIPVGFGLNSAQYIVLYAAKFGSNFATNGWNTFNTVLVDGARRNLVGDEIGNAVRLAIKPNMPESAMNELIQFMYVARTCKWAEEMAYNKENIPRPQWIDIRPYLVRGVTFAPATDNYLEVNGGTTYAALLNFANGSTVVTMRFGIRRAPNATPVPGDPNVVGANETDYGWYKGYVKPICGEVKIHLTDPRQPAVGNAGTELLQQYYWFVVKKMWFLDWEGPFTVGQNFPRNIVSKYGPPKNTTLLEPDPSIKRLWRDYYRREMRWVATGIPMGAPGSIFPGPVPLGGAARLQIASGKFGVPNSLREKGWAGAGIWYNRIAEMNGSLTSSAYKIPVVSRYPYIMEYVKEKKRQYNQATKFEEMFIPMLADGQDIHVPRPQDEWIIQALNVAYTYWAADGGLSSTHTETTGNIILDAINLLLGTDGLYSMRRNPDVHPLAQLAGVGRSLVESSIRSLVYAGVGKIFEVVTDEAVGKVFASFFVTITMIGLTAGFILFYVVPFLPFIYFFFAVSGWVKGIFEGMVGAPLWALAHIRIDGEGLPGQAAMNGYFLIFEIFIRPILIIFGLLASITIFAALVDVLNMIFDLATSNLTGFDVDCEISGCGLANIEFYRGPIDEFFFTVMYALLVYLMGLSSFKLIDLIPNNILRWMGASVPTFNDQREDPTQGMIGTATIGTQQTLSSLGGGLQKILQI